MSEDSPNTAPTKEMVGAVLFCIRKSKTVSPDVLEYHIAHYARLTAITSVFV
jgi:hypothetical protein